MAHRSGMFTLLAFRGGVDMGTCQEHFKLGRTPLSCETERYQKTNIAKQLKRGYSGYSSLEANLFKSLRADIQRNKPDTLRDNKKYIKTRFYPKHIPATVCAAWKLSSSLLSSWMFFHPSPPSLWSAGNREWRYELPSWSCLWTFRSCPEVQQFSTGEERSRSKRTWPWSMCISQWAGCDFASQRIWDCLGFLPTLSDSTSRKNIDGKRRTLGNKQSNRVRSNALRLTPHNPPVHPCTIYPPFLLGKDNSSCGGFGWESCFMYTPVFTVG